MGVSISDHFTFKKIFKITIFPIIMMVFTSIYSIVDGIFISNFSTNSAFTAVNLVMPFIMIIGSIGFMFGSGGTALVSRYLGEGNKEKASKTFSAIIYSTITLGIVFSLLGFILMEPIVKAMASLSSDSSEEMIKEAIKYGRILASFQILFMLQNAFQSFFMVAEKSRLGFLFILSGGLTNIVLDALLVGVFNLGVVGAATATISGYAIGSIGPVIYFITNKNSIISLGKTKIIIKDIIQAMYNGVSEFVGNIAFSIVSIVYNAKLLTIYGQNGVAAYGIIMYVSFVFIAIFIGYSMGIAPVVGYNFGARNNLELKNVLKKSLIIISCTSLIMFSFSFFMAKPFSKIFSNQNEDLFNLASTAMMIFSLAFLFNGISIYTSSFFTALNNGTISALVSILRTLVFQIGFVFIFEALFGGIGIWWAIVAGEFLASLLSLTFIIINKKKYNY